MKDWKSSIGRNTYTIVLFYFLKGRWQGDSENNNTAQVRKKEEGHQCRRRCNKYLLKLPKVKLEFAKQSFYYSGAKKSIMSCQLTYSLSFWKRRGPCWLVSFLWDLMSQEYYFIIELMFADVNMFWTDSGS